MKPSKIKKIIIGSKYSKCKRLSKDKKLQDTIYFPIDNNLDKSWCDSGGLRTSKELDYIYDEVYDNHGMEEEKIIFYETFQAADTHVPRNDGVKDLELADITSKINQLHEKLDGLHQLEREYFTQLRVYYNNIKDLV